MRFISLVLYCMLISNGLIAQNWVNEKYLKNHEEFNIKVVYAILNDIQMSHNTEVGNLVFTRIDTGAKDSLVSYKGKVVVISLWQSYCKPCITEMPALQKIEKEFKDKDVVMVYISPEDADIQKKTYAEQKIEFSGIKARVSDENYILPFQYMSNPTGFIIDRSGVIRETWIQAQSYESLKDRIQGVLMMNW
jgi:peroxiredoxin